ncbi:MAG: PilZ domain-containing protein [Magnetococcales bacterium]|nr:PilZ domain-containing protein [Magnetococcales bacterium]
MDDFANRRQAYRINDDVAFSWKIVHHDDIVEAQGYLKQNDRLPTRARESRLRNLLDHCKESLRRLDKRFTRTEMLLSGFADELLLSFQRVSRLQEEDAVLQCVLHLQDISEEIASKPEGITGQFGQILTLMRKRLEQRQKDAGLDPLFAVNRLAQSAEIVGKINQDIEKLTQELTTLAPTLTQHLTAFDSSLSALPVSKVDTKKGLAPGKSGHMVKSQVNLSATGVAFRTMQDIFEKGDYVQLNLELSANGLSYDTYTAYGQVVLVKQLAVGKPYRIATQFILIPRKMEEDLGAHIARRQRELLLIK